MIYSETRVSFGICPKLRPRPPRAGVSLQELPPVLSSLSPMLIEYVKRAKKKLIIHLMYRFKLEFRKENWKTKSCRYKYRTGATISYPIGILVTTNQKQELYMR